jgi:undecaprenyl diphosphate synthase
LVPKHIAMIMDGNGRWAKRRHLPRVAGHARGVKRVRDMVEFCVARNIRYLTLFAFSTENWKRPVDEVNHLMGLFISALEGEVSKLHKNGIRLRIIGDLHPFNLRLQALIASAEARTASNDHLTLTIAANYGGQWDIRQAFSGWLKARQDAGFSAAEQINPGDIDLKPYLSMAYAPDPDLVIRTGGEQRISNFLLWQSAYAELYFTDTLWPAFDAAEMEQALAWYAQRERRFGQTSQQSRVVARGCSG